jgi:hypothetical protein
MLDLNQLDIDRLKTNPLSTIIWPKFQAHITIQATEFSNEPSTRAINSSFRCLTVPWYGF